MRYAKAVAEPSRTGEKRFLGIPVARGVGRGRLFVFHPTATATVPQYGIRDEDVPEQTQKLEHALLRSREQIHDIQKRVRENMGANDAAIFDAQLLLLDDPVLLEEVVRFLRREHVNVEHAFSVVSHRYLAAFGAIDDDYLRERMVDMRDVVDRILHNLLQREGPVGLADLREPSILVTDDLTPSQTALLDRDLIMGFATDQGSRTSHTAILAQSLQLPAVVGLCNASRQVRSGQYALLDGFNGALIVDPTDQTLFEYGQLARKHVAREDRLRELRDQAAITLDNVGVALSANIEQTTETAAVKDKGADGVGLFRTEYLFLNRDTTPSEEEQYQTYHRVATDLHPSPVIIRTLDLGGDKVQSKRTLPVEMNPFMGLRAIRVCLQQHDLFRTQLRAILRASAVGNVKMMYPMISGLDELNQANRLVEQCKTDLHQEKVPFDPDLEIGVMIEVPAAALIAETLARRVKFFSIGTNDLIQYTLAVDRLNPQIAHLYQPTHPAVLRLIKHTIDAAHQHGIWTGICGAMAGDPVLVPLLLGLGADELSVAPSLVPAVKLIIRRLKSTEARALADFALGCEDLNLILERCQSLAEDIAPGLFANDHPGTRFPC
ncbi:MAG TPA: phosphoenolpyruvate--protein phosphotransferase [Candidatus Paceibacterota bacterium]|nr:phosphoenolpyruvate--protein phosphotransferase [Candidatus Paceibacterota bacterium]HRZ54322.1 phosphoenolpyruvate--protein phosphotransferase [Candidatus Paceibacterota bacterium]